MPLYDYRCKQGHVSEMRRGTEVTQVVCATCGENALRLSVYRQVEQAAIRKLPGKDFTEASEMLESRRVELEKKEGWDIPSPSLWGAAQARAKRLMAQGATSSKDVR